jgi:hypothetical protein
MVLSAYVNPPAASGATYDRATKNLVSLTHETVA